MLFFHRKKLNFWERFAYKHTLTAIITGVAFVFVVDTAIVQALLEYITDFGYVGILLSGILFVSFFTAAPAIVLLIAFAQEYDPIVVAAIGGAGAMLGDFVILHFAEDRIGRELAPIAKRLKLMSFIQMLHKKRMKPITAVVGAVIIASPLPDEAGVALLGLSSISSVQLLGLTFILNSAGILALVVSFKG